MNHWKYIIAVFCVFVFASCSNKTDVKFLGKSLKSSPSSFIEHLESNGFTKDGETYKGKYLGKDVFIILGDTTKGCFDKIVVTALFAKYGESNYAPAKDYYKRVYRTIEKEHSGFEKEEEKDAESESKEYYAENGGKVNVLFQGSETSDKILCIVSVGFHVGE
ncbi:MAG: hypothetical protein SPL64_06775 [Bacteroidaceae bacterium]|nr:hypothetical protein [Bacteroidaceae bacterium]